MQNAKCYQEWKLNKKLKRKRIITSIILALIVVTILSLILIITGNDAEIACSKYNNVILYNHCLTIYTQ